MEQKRPFSKLDWLSTPEPVQQYIITLEQMIIRLSNRVAELEKRTDKLERKTKTNSQNSSKPPSSDSPFNKPKKKSKKSKRKRGAQKGHKGYQQQILKPTFIEYILPSVCQCGCCQFVPQSIVPYYTHQHIELPEIKPDITHFILHQARCNGCGKTVKSHIPKAFNTGYGPRLSAVIAELSGTHGESRHLVKDFCQSVLGFHISTGAIQNIIDRVSTAIEPLYNTIGELTRKAAVNGVDETSWFQSGKLKWLWTMVNDAAAYFMIHPNRSKQAFETLVENWNGILISDNYGTYIKWINKRQTCIAHYIRKARNLSESNDESISSFGQLLSKLLQRLCSWAKDPPSEKQWTELYSQLIMLLILFEGADDDAGKLARSVGKEMDSLWVFLEEDGVEPTNNRAERALRFGVIWRKRSYGTQSDKGDRWVERILTLKQTCRLRSLPVFPILHDAIDSFFKDQNPDLSWVTAK